MLPGSVGFPFLEKVEQSCQKTFANQSQLHFSPFCAFSNFGKVGKCLKLSFQEETMTSLDINANHGEAKDDEVEISSMKKVTRRKSRNSCEYDDFGLIEVHNCLVHKCWTIISNLNTNHIIIENIAIIERCQLRWS